ncbi:hypothetical protein IJG72_01805, partial [bacterium]|nr:hypothetical protein [bacterium]
MEKFKMAQTGSQKVFPMGGGGKASRSKAFGLLSSLKTFICNLFKGELSRVNGEQSRQSRVNREQNDINANNCRTV